MKNCTRCGKAKPLDDFYRHGQTRDGRNSWCKACSNEDAAGRAKANPERDRVYKRKSAAKHRGKYDARREAWRRKNRDRVNAKRRERWASHPGGREAQKANRARKQLTPQQRLNVAIRAGIYAAIKAHKAGRRWESLVGYTLADLTRWIEQQFRPGMTWDNYGEWHVDHMVPIAAFKFTTPECPGFRACWSLTNLQPLWGPDNQSKGGRCTYPEIAEALTILSRSKCTN